MQNPVTCLEIVRQLWPYLDGALSDELQETVARHLQRCDGCRSHFDFERAFLDAVHSLQPDDAEFEPLRAKVLRALEADGMSVR